MILDRADKQSFKEKILGIASQQKGNGLTQEMKLLQALPQKLFDLNFSECFDDLEILSTSEIVNVSRTAAYSYKYHKKRLKALTRNIEFRNIE